MRNPELFYRGITRSMMSFWLTVDFLYIQGTLLRVYSTEYSIGTFVNKVGAEICLEFVGCAFVENGVRSRFFQVIRLMSKKFAESIRSNRLPIS